MIGVKTKQFDFSPERTSFTSGASQISVSKINGKNPTDIIAVSQNQYDYVTEIKRVEISGIADSISTIEVLAQWAPNSPEPYISLPKAPFYGIQRWGGAVGTYVQSPCDIIQLTDYNVARNGVDSNRPLLSSGFLTFSTPTTQGNKLIFEYTGANKPTLSDIVNWYVINLKGQEMPPNAKISISIEYEAVRKVRVSMCGDSTYYAGTVIHRTLTKNQRINSYVQFDNLGCNGYRLFDFVNGTSGINFPLNTIKNGRTNDIVCLGYGINDCRTGMTNESQLIALLESAIATLINTNKDCKIILHGPNPLALDNFNNMNYVSNLNSFSGMTIAESAQRATEIMYNSYEHFRNDPRVFAVVQRQDVLGKICKTVADGGYLTDQLHPNGNGQQIISKQLEPVIEKAIKAIIGGISYV